MPRKPRLSVPGSVNHVMARCLDGQSLFFDDDDRSHFLQLLSRYLHETNCRCYAWALMTNHYHLLLRTGENDLWRTMKPLNMRFAQFHGRKHGRRGALFMDRFKSIVTADQNYVQELVRYVHLNPIRAGILKSMAELDTYPWTGHAALMGRGENDFQDRDAVLLRFGKDRTVARREYRRFLCEGSDRADDDTLVELVRQSNAGIEKGRNTSCWVIGDQAFVKKTIQEAHQRRLRLRRIEVEGPNFSEVARKVCRALGVCEESLLVRHRGGPAPDARRAFAYVCVRNREIRTSEVAKYLRVSPGAVSNMVRAGRQVAEDRGLLSI